MGFFRNMKITNMAFQITYRGMKLMSDMRKQDPDMAPSGAEAVENIGDELATLSRDFCVSEKERACVLKGLRQGLKALGLSETASQNISALLTQRIMAGTPSSSLGDELSRIMPK